MSQKAGKKVTVSSVSRYAYDGVETGSLPSLDDRFNRVLSVGEECQKPDELKKILQSNPSPVAYDGFEPSGRMHIAQGVLKKLNVDKMTSAGFTYVFWVADWFAMLNHKMGGDLEKIKVVGRYFIEVWKAVGMDMDRVKFLWASEEIGARPEEYWGLVLDISTKFSLPRVQRCCTIMGRTDTGLSSSQIVYPCMQTADIFFMEVDVCQLGVDQRKVNMLAREYRNKRKNEVKNPVILSHHMLLGLKKGQEKMSKSDPDSAIFMEDTEKDIKRKIGKAFCPPKEVYETKRIYLNPIFDYLAYTIEKKGAATFSLSEGQVVITTKAELEEAVLAKRISNDDMKIVLIPLLQQIVGPIRDALANVGDSVPLTPLNSSLLPLKKGQESGATAIPGNLIFITDTDAQITEKIDKAFIPNKFFYEKKVAINPCMDYFKHLIFPSFEMVTIERTEEYGGSFSPENYDDFEKTYISGVLDPADLKGNLVRYLNELVKPVREHFQNDPEAKKLLELVKKYRVTK